MSLQQKLDKLKIQQKEIENQLEIERELFMKTDVDHNLKILKNCIDARKDKAIRNRYSKNKCCFMKKNADHDMIPILTSIYNLLITTNNKINKLENRLNSK